MNSLHEPLTYALPWELPLEYNSAYLLEKTACLNFKAFSKSSTVIFFIRPHPNRLNKWLDLRRDKSPKGNLGCPSFYDRLQFVTDSAPGNETLLLLDFKDALEPLRVIDLDLPSDLTISANEHHRLHLHHCPASMTKRGIGLKGFRHFLQYVIFIPSTTPF